MPVLISTGERDGYLNCCLIRTVRKIDDAATQGGALVTLVARAAVPSTRPMRGGRVLATLKRDHRQPE